LNSTTNSTTNGISENNKRASTSSPQLLRMLKIAKMLKMLKLLRMMKLKKLLANFEEFIVTDSISLIVTFMSVIVRLFVVGHYMSCIFFYVGQDEENNGFKQNWINSQSIGDKPILT